MIHLSEFDLRKFKENGIRKIVWEGPHVSADRDSTVRGLVGLTDAGNYKPGQAAHYRVHDFQPTGRVEYSGANFKWGENSYAGKEPAITAAHKWANETALDLRQRERTYAIERAVRKDVGQSDVFKANGIRRIVWNGPHVEAAGGRMVRASVGQARTGGYRAAAVSLDRQDGPAGRVAFTPESYAWDEKQYAYKEQAIFAAREAVTRILKSDRQTEAFDRTYPEPDRSAAAKYGGANEPLQHELSPPKRSR